MFLGAPDETRYAAILALSVGIVGLAWSLSRSYQLRRASNRLRAIEPSADSESNWERVETVVTLTSFLRMMKRLNRARQAGSSEPEATWRAGFDLIADAEERIEAAIRSLASVAVLFGLAGTVLGFASLAGPLLAIQRGVSSISISSELSGAFLGTLAGIFGAATILLGAVPVLRSAEEAWLSAVEDIGRSVLIPALPRPLTKIGDIVLEELKRKLDAVRDAWVSALAEPAKLLTNLASSAQSSVGQLGEVLSGINPETLKELASSARSMKTSANSIAKSSTYYESSIGELSKVSAEFERTLGDLKTAFTDNSSRVERMELTLTGARNEVERQGEALAASLNSMASKFESLEASVLKRMEQESGIFNKAGQTVEAIDEHLKQLAKGAQELFSSTRDVTVAASALKDAVTPLPSDLATALNKWLTTFQREEGALFAQMRESLVTVSLSLTRASEWIAMTAQSQRTGAQIARLPDDLRAARSVETDASRRAGLSGSATDKLLFEDEQTPLPQAEKSGATKMPRAQASDEGRQSGVVHGGEAGNSSRHFLSSEMPTLDLTMVEVGEESVNATGSARPDEPLKASDHSKGLPLRQNVGEAAGSVSLDTRAVETGAASFEAARPELDRDNEGNSFHVALDASGRLDNPDERADSNREEARSPKAEPGRRGLLAWLRRRRG